MIETLVVNYYTIEKLRIETISISIIYKNLLVILVRAIFAWNDPLDCAFT
jgi:hypothetical protein